MSAGEAREGVAVMFSHLQFLRYSQLAVTNFFSLTLAFGTNLL